MLLCLFEAKKTMTAELNNLCNHMYEVFFMYITTSWVIRLNFYLDHYELLLLREDHQGNGVVNDL